MFELFHCDILQLFSIADAVFKDPITLIKASQQFFVYIKSISLRVLAYIISTAFTFRKNSNLLWKLSHRSGFCPFYFISMFLLQKVTYISIITLDIQKVAKLLQFQEFVINN